MFGKDNNLHFNLISLLLVVVFVFVFSAETCDQLTHHAIATRTS